MVNKNTQKPDDAPKKKDRTGFAFLAYAAFVFTALIISLVVILMRSHQG